MDLLNKREALYKLKTPGFRGLKEIFNYEDDPQPISLKILLLQQLKYPE